MDDLQYTAQFASDTEEITAAMSEDSSFSTSVTSDEEFTAEFSNDEEPISAQMSNSDTEFGAEIDGAVDWDDITGKPATFPPSEHNHDGRYYTETEVDNLLEGKVDVEEGKGLSSNDYTDAEKQKVTDAYTDRHTHSNKSVLDGITGIDTTITSGSNKLITSGAVYSAVGDIGDVIDEIRGV